MEILCIKDHVCSSKNDFRERNRAITNPRPFELKKKEEEEQFSENPCSCIFYGV